MELFTNLYLEPGKVVHVFGTRTLVIANNTKQEGMYFKDVHITVQRKGYTSSFSINAEKKNNIVDVTFGLYFGRNAEPITGVKFEGKTERNEAIYKFYLCKVGAIIKEDGINWILKEDGWVSAGHYEIQLWEEIGRDHRAWVPIHPANSKDPYQYATLKEAIRMLDILYPMEADNHKRTHFVAY